MASNLGRRFEVVIKNVGVKVTFINVSTDF